MNSNSFSSFLNAISPLPLHVLDKRIHKSHYVSINLSETNSIIEPLNMASPIEWDLFIQDYCKHNHAKVAFGGYNETRNIYKRSTYFNQSNLETERNIHLGMDLWVAAETPIYAPLDGVVHSFANNANFGDYGPTLILEHHIQGVQFYTLYGHLSLETLSDKKIGALISSGEQIARLGTAEVNGDYAPHLHFQIIHDLEGCFGDYPGVCNKKDLNKFLNNCPDPNLLLKLN